LASSPPTSRMLTGHAVPEYQNLYVAFSPDGATLASGGADGTIILWDIATGAPRGRPLPGHSDRVYSLAFNPDGSILASSSCGGRSPTGECLKDEIILGDRRPRQPLGPPLSGHSGPANSIAFSPDGKILASGSWDHTIILWDVANR